MTTSKKTALPAKAITIKFFFAVLLVAVTLSVTSFTNPAPAYLPAVTDCRPADTEGKAWWITYYIKNKTLYISSAYNNDCFYCSNEITQAFHKWLILNDYDNTPSTVNITSQYALSEADVEEKREKILLRYKGYGYSVVKVGFTYKEK